jgi:hypothetical protein
MLQELLRDYCNVPLVTSAARANGNGFGTTLAFESEGRLRGNFIDGDRILYESAPVGYLNLHSVFPARPLKREKSVASTLLESQNCEVPESCNFLRCPESNKLGSLRAQTFLEGEA